MPGLRDFGVMAGTVLAVTTVLGNAGSARPAATIWPVPFKKAVTTRALGGENHGKPLTNHHVVTELVRLGDWRGGAAQVEAPDARPGSDQGRAVLLQGDRRGAILDAAPCPMAGA